MKPTVLPVFWSWAFRSVLIQGQVEKVKVTSAVRQLPNALHHLWDLVVEEQWPGIVFVVTVCVHLLTAGGPQLMWIHVVCLTYEPKWSSQKVINKAFKLLYMKTYEHGFDGSSETWLNYTLKITFPVHEFALFKATTGFWSIAFLFCFP